MAPECQKPVLEQMAADAVVAAAAAAEEAVAVVAGAVLRELQGQLRPVMRDALYPLEMAYCWPLAVLAMQYELSNPCCQALLVQPVACTSRLCMR